MAYHPHVVWSGDFVIRSKYLLTKTCGILESDLRIFMSLKK